MFGDAKVDMDRSMNSDADFMSQDRGATDADFTSKPNTRKKVGKIFL